MQLLSAPSKGFFVVPASGDLAVVLQKQAIHYGALSHCALERWQNGYPSIARLEPNGLHTPVGFFAVQIQDFSNPQI
jgi:hypothetical protein